MNRTNEFFALCSPNQQKRKEDINYPLLHEYRKIQTDITKIYELSELDRKKWIVLKNRVNHLRTGLKEFVQGVKDEHTEEIGNIMGIFMVEIAIEMGKIEKRTLTETLTEKKTLTEKRTETLTEKRTEKGDRKRYNPLEEEFTHKPVQIHSQIHSQSDRYEQKLDNSQINKRPVQRERERDRDTIKLRMTELGTLLTEISLHTQIQGEQLKSISESVRKTENLGIQSVNVLRSGFEKIRGRRRGILWFLIVWTVIILIILFIKWF